MVKTVPNITEVHQIETRLKTKKSLKETNNKNKINSKGIIKCNYSGCEMIFNTRLGLNRHRTKCHKSYLKNEIFKCDVKGCNAVYSRYTGLHAHRNVHLGKFKCDFDGCNYCAHSAHALRKHRILHSEDRPFKCKECDKCFKDNVGLRFHTIKVHPQLCPDLPLLKCKEKDCQYSTKHRYKYNAHKTSHSLSFECNICHKKFGSKDNLKRHELTHKEGRTYECSECNKMYHTPATLNRHMQSHKPKRNISNDKKYLCDWPECGKRFLTRQQLKWHMNRHNGVKPYRCDWPDCGKTYGCGVALYKHKRTHIA